VAAACVAPAITVLVVATGDPAGLIVANREVADTAVGSFLRVDPAGPWYYVIAGYTYLLGLIGSVRSSSSSVTTPARSEGQSAALLVGTAAPWVSSLLHVTGAIPVPGLDPAPLAFAVSGGRGTSSRSRGSACSRSPAPRRRASWCSSSFTIPCSSSVPRATYST